MNKKLLLIMLGVLGILMIVLSGCNGPVAGQAFWRDQGKACVGADTKADYAVKGTVLLAAGGSVADECLVSGAKTYVFEKGCKAGKTTVSSKNCNEYPFNKDYKCVDGACVKNVISVPVKPSTETICADGIDNDNDKQIDCVDSDCMNITICQPQTGTPKVLFSVFNCSIDNSNNIVVNGKTVVSQCVEDPLKDGPIDWVGYDLSSVIQKYTCENGFLKAFYEQCYCQKVNGVAVCKDMNNDFKNVPTCIKVGGDNPFFNGSLKYNNQLFNDICVSEEGGYYDGADYNFLIGFISPSGNYLVENYCQANFVGTGMWKIPNYANPASPATKTYFCNCNNGTCSCPAGTTGTYPQCKCDDAQVFSVNENKCVGK